MSTSFAQYEFMEIEELKTKAQNLISDERHEEGYELYRQIDYRISIHHGLYSLERLPYLLDIMEWNKQLRSWEEASDKRSLIKWLLGKNEPNVENSNKLLYRLLDMPIDPECLMKEDWLYTNGRIECVEMRHFLADSYISAVEVQQEIVEIEENVENWLLLSKIAHKTAEIVYGVDGPPIIYIDSIEGIRPINNPDIHPKYTPYRYLSIARDAMLESTVCCDSI